VQILIADDEDIARLELESLLRRHGFDVVETADGTEALEALRQKVAPKLAILDWMTDQLDGIEVCRQLRADDRLKSVYVILLTSRGDREHVVQGLQAGANDYVTKPVDREELLSRVQAGAQTVRLQTELAQRLLHLENSVGVS
jgi:DNA-binding response OmpR family regulator